MSVSLIIVLLLIIAYRAGARRGLVQTIVNVVGYVAVAFAAGYLAHEYGPCFAEKMPQIANEGNGFLAAAGINLNSSFYQIMLFWIDLQIVAAHFFAEFLCILFSDSDA